MKQTKIDFLPESVGPLDEVVALGLAWAVVSEPFELIPGKETVFARLRNEPNGDKSALLLSQCHPLCRMSARVGLSGLSDTELDTVLDSLPLDGHESKRELERAKHCLEGEENE